MKLVPLLAACLVAAPLSPASADVSARPRAGAAFKSADAAAAIVCRKWTRTGSRIASARVCKTRAEWDKELAELRLVLDQTRANMRVLSGPQGRDAFRACLSC